jgi:hypothetical protein
VDPGSRTNKRPAMCAGESWHLVMTAGIGEPLTRNTGEECRKFLRTP